MKKILTFGLATSALLISSTQVQAASFLSIDDFETESQVVNLTGPVVPPATPLTASDTSGFSSGILGGFRELFIEMTLDPSSTGSNAIARVSENLITTDGTFSISNDDGVVSSTIATWDANGAGLGLNVDLLSSSIHTDAFTLDIKSLESNAEFTFTVMGNNGETATLFVDDLPGVNFPSEAYSALFKYEDFILTGGTTNDLFSNVKSIALEVTGPASFDASFDNFAATNTSVPEPAAVFGLLLSVGYGALAKKKKQA